MKIGRIILKFPLSVKPIFRIKTKNMFFLIYKPIFGVPWAAVISYVFAYVLVASAASPASDTQRGSEPRHVWAPVPNLSTGPTKLKHISGDGRTYFVIGYPKNRYAKNQVC